MEEIVRADFQALHFVRFPLPGGEDDDRYAAALRAEGFAHIKADHLSGRDEGEDMEEKKTVLIVEDEKSIVDIVRFNLEKEGYAVLAAYDGEAGPNTSG